MVREGPLGRWLSGPGPDCVPPANLNLPSVYGYVTVSGDELGAAVTK